VMSFVRDEAGRRSRDPSPASAKPAKKHVKVLVWDLDNTVWQGTLIEDGPGNVTLRPGVMNVIRELDRRGIVNTLVSKNNEPDVAQELKRFGLDEYMVFPQVGWNPKSLSLRELIHRFNVGEDAFAFIDDSPFEREEVRQSLPAVRIYDAADYSELAGRPEFQPPQSSESARRREFYLNQDRRDQALAEFGGTYEEFLRKWNIQLSVARARAAQLDRITELAQRTNQLNFSGTRYSRAELAELLEDEALDCFVMSCVDNFGDYGTVGFAIVETDGPRLIDLMFSCRVQAKRVEHAFLEFLLSRYSKQGSTELLARYVQTERNSAAGKVFDDLSFEPVSNDDDAKTYRLGLNGANLGGQPVTVYWEGRPWAW
jgi:FkbH-like protein